MPAVDISEKHFTVAELAENWNVHPNTVRKVFDRVPDVVTITLPSKNKRRYRAIRIPHSVAERVYRGLRGLGPRQTVAVERAAPKPAIDPNLTGLERRQTEMRERMRRSKH